VDVVVLPRQSKLAPDEFLAWEREQEDRHFYVGGEVFAMAGGSPRHNRLSARAIARLESGLEGGPCGVYSSDQKVGLPNDEFVYADAVVICGQPTLRGGTSDVVTNPSAVIEVLSKSTEAYDRGDKQKGYLALASIQHFVLMSQREARVEVYTRQADGSFRYDVVETGATIHLDRIGMSIAVDALYDGVLDLPGD
jgi:Uma2 family endonuclease